MYCSVTLHNYLHGALQQGDVLLPHSAHASVETDTNALCVGVVCGVCVCVGGEGKGEVDSEEETWYTCNKSYSGVESLAPNYHS